MDWIIIRLIKGEEELYIKSPDNIEYIDKAIKLLNLQKEYIKHISKGEEEKEVVKRW